ncbi:MAG: hypothetical protein CMJ64_13340 [Planctomycetaceae bacterium]|nr:hypothetical protein [Planctomycetaceae bacterium]
MFLAEPQQTPYDFNFQIMGFRVRVSPFFWLMAIVLGWSWASAMAQVYSRDRVSPAALKVMDDPSNPMYQRVAANLKLVDSNPGQGMLLLIWVAAVFVSILVHELGHSLAMRRYGIHSYMILYHFGGLAVPDSAGSFMGMSRRSDPYQQIYISAAGPGLQLALAGAVILLAKVAGYKVAGYALPVEIPHLSELLHLDAGRPIASLPLLALAQFTLLPSIFWAILNLLPVYPLDGGQIARELLTMYSPRDGMKNSLMLSIAVGGGVAVYGLANDQMMLGMMFGMLAFSSFQILQAISGRGGGYGPW